MSPIISTFFGIIVRLQFELGGKHHLPHVHAEYQDYEIYIDFEGSVLAGTFPKKQLKVLQAWIELHKDELQANWKVYQEEGTWFKIDPIGRI
ncbi:DUF4160 domain-containing protein [Clostridium butyricum]|uniref:DUF4160 domain-containing protein n=1 Tax=Clostridium butyricum TaxID=1492 RepID=UPI000B01BC40|nr:DUF4160 domain-containing protein [Clostridium butyricum]MDM8133292.1 DUF4160 domain-containing protein [Clostridium butyricum]MDM8231584.1 DUF4160 domain-containing protein [Clostridium butyricum]MDU1006529.1 DUF4160 domain-containing protein [Clostridium butyricum]MDU4659178.1 DUF4160 domain-containing protein [Clostridium butyricum]